MTAEPTTDPALRGRRVVHLHVGAPKTGTTQLQDVLFSNRDLLREHGVLVPGQHRQSQFHATVDLLDMSWGGVLETARGAFDDLTAQIQDWPGDVVISNENLCVADEATIARVRAALPDHELRVVYSARDLIRQIPAAWQEKVKHSSTSDYGTFVHNLREDPDEEGSRRFWHRQTWPEVVDRWSRGLGGVPATVVTVPATGQDQELLLGRFCEAFGLAGEWLPDRTARSNPGLGPRETTMLRIIQAELDARDTKGAVRRTSLRGAMLGRWWASRPTSGRVALPAEARDWASDLSREWVGRLQASDVRVVGDLTDLVPTDAVTSTAVDPDKVGADELLVLAVRTIADALEEQADLVGQRRLLTRERDDLRAVTDDLRAAAEGYAAERDAARARVAELERSRWQAAKERMVAAAHDNWALGIGYAGYRLLRRR
ncbi:MAG: hypothetical protein H0U77_04300 [Nocardioidaceae bacterium]|nr:hypothetical protein [Nocardioidaceae bacterium]